MPLRLRTWFMSLSITQIQYISGIKFSLIITKAQFNFKLLLPHTNVHVWHLHFDVTVSLVLFYVGNNNFQWKNSDSKTHSFITSHFSAETWMMTISGWSPSWKYSAVSAQRNSEKELSHQSDGINKTLPCQFEISTNKSKNHQRVWNYKTGLTYLKYVHFSKPKA